MRYLLLIALALSLTTSTSTHWRPASDVISNEEIITNYQSQMSLVQIKCTLITDDQLLSRGNRLMRQLCHVENRYQFHVSRYCPHIIYLPERYYSVPASHYGGVLYLPQSTAEGIPKPGSEPTLMNCITAAYLFGSWKYTIVNPSRGWL
ncbi:hypothetical protein CC78DRAFT_585535 [Lojkania enalia]|uniref:Uncharacterized protein n=1 Tax=Lojkania enalia TaxID=147567 RepID=A0A9P4K0B4_9PLEO|nr:hypothetical protein CC78DRAFT_585535 [Didymosphaeria enalia]